VRGVEVAHDQDAIAAEFLFVQELVEAFVKAQLVGHSAVVSLLAVAVEDCGSLCVNAITIAIPPTIQPMEIISFQSI